MKTMEKNAETRTQKEFDNEQRDLEHQLLRSLVEDNRPEFERESNPIPKPELLERLKVLCKDRTFAKPYPVEPERQRAVARDGEGDNAAAEFGARVVTEAFIRLINQIGAWFTPAVGDIRWCNATDKTVNVRTFDERDEWYWVGYMGMTVPPMTSVSLTARGGVVQVQVMETGGLFKCPKGASFLYDGVSSQIRTK